MERTSKDLNKPQIAFFDIDGTILMPDHTYQKSTVEAFKTLRSKGIEVALATGRPIHEIEDLIKELEVSIVIGYNGTLALKDGEILFKRPFNDELTHYFIEKYEEMDCQFAIYSHGKSVFSHLAHNKVEEFRSIFQMQYNEEWSDGDEVDIYGATYIDAPENIREIVTHDDVRIAPVNIEGLHNCYDFILHKENKGIAVKEVCRLLSINIKDAIAFGDGLNDAEMLEAVGVGVAMGNATDDLLPFADMQTTSVHEDGIYEGLKKLQLI